MWNIFKKDAKFITFYLAALLAGVVVLRFAIGDPLSTLFVIVSGILVYLLVFGEIFINEQYEEKHRGYMFLRTLPLNIREIVTAKFLRVFFSSVLLVGFILLLISLSSGRQENFILARSFILINGVIALIAGGLAFIGLFGMGYTLFLKASLFVLVLLQCIPFLLLSTRKEDIFIERTLEFLPTVNWLVVIPLVLVVYVGLMWAAIKVKNLRPS